MNLGQRSATKMTTSSHLAAQQFDCRSQSAIALRKTELIGRHEQWLQSQPEIREVLADFMQGLLFHKPDDALGYMRQYFTDVRATAAPLPTKRK